VPKAINAMFSGARFIPNYLPRPPHPNRKHEEGEYKWNYGCPGHAHVSDVLFNFELPQQGDQRLNVPQIIRGEEPEIKNNVTCKGKNVPLEQFRYAVGSELFRFRPFFDQAIAKTIADLALPDNFLAVHIRGGDKLIREWRKYEKYRSISTWEEHIRRVIFYENSHYRPFINSVFIESDDCGLTLELKRLLESNGERFIRVYHIECDVVSSNIEKGNSTIAITGHNQRVWNQGQSCTATTRLFAALTIFRDARTVLLSLGGHKGVTPPGHALKIGNLPSRTVMLIEYLRLASDSAKRNYYADPKEGEVLWASIHDFQVPTSISNNTRQPHHHEAAASPS